MANTDDKTYPNNKPPQSKQSSEQPDNKQKLWRLIIDICENKEEIDVSILDDLVKDSLLCPGIWHKDEVSKLLQLVLLSFRDPTMQALMTECRHEIAAMITILSENHYMQHSFIPSKIKPLCYAIIKGAEPKTVSCEQTRILELSHFGMFVHENSANGQATLEIDFEKWDRPGEATNKLIQIIRKMVSKIDTIIQKHHFEHIATKNMPYQCQEQLGTRYTKIISYSQGVIAKILVFQLINSIAEVATTTTTISQAQIKLQPCEKFRLYYLPYPPAISKNDIQESIVWDWHRTNLENPGPKSSPFEIALKWHRNSVLLQVAMIPNTRDWENLDNTEPFVARADCKRSAAEIVSRLSLKRATSFTTVEKARIVKLMARFSKLYSQDSVKNRKWSKISTMIISAIDDMAWYQRIAPPERNEQHIDLWKMIMDQNDPETWTKESSVIKPQLSTTLLSTQNSRNQTFEQISQKCESINEKYNDDSNSSTGMDPCMASKSANNDVSYKNETESEEDESVGSTNKTKINSENPELANGNDSSESYLSSTNNMNVQRSTRHKKLQPPGKRSVSKNDSETDEYQNSELPRYKRRYTESTDDLSFSDNSEEDQSQSAPSDQSEQFAEEYRQRIQLDNRSDQNFEDLVQMLGQKIKNLTSQRVADQNSSLLEESLLHYGLYMDFIRLKQLKGRALTRVITD